MSSDFHEILNTISDNENSENSAEVKDQLRKLGSLYDDTVAKLTTFGAENKSKRVTNAELEREKNDLQAQIEVLNKQVTSLDPTELKNKIKSLEEQSIQWTDKARSELQKKLQTASKHQNWDKAKTYFDISQSDKGDFDLADMTLDQTQKHISELQKLENLGVIGSQVSAPKPQTFSATTARPEANGGMTDEQMQDKDQVTKYISEELQKDMGTYVPPPGE